MDDVTASSGSRRANFDDTFRRCYGPMVRSLSVACGDAEVAADCVQDAFTRAYTRWGRVSSLDDPAGWVRHVAVNRIRDHFRRAQRGQRALERLAGRASMFTEAPAVPSELGRLLASLPDQQRIAAALFYVEDLSVAEVATAMALSAGAVKYHLHAARESLRNALEPQA
jgi:RNA polymerase sigma-70 factor (ECF subfamily)